jgi:hypothetical protein
MDTGQKVGFAIAAAMSGFGSALQGRGGNPVLDMLSAAEERDLRAQELGLQAKGRGIQMRESLYGHLIEEGHSKEVSLLAARDAKNGVISDLIAAAAAKAQTGSEQERMAKVQADWAVKMQQDRTALEQTLARHTTSSSTSSKQTVMMDQNGNPVVGGGAGQRGNDANVTVRNLTSIPGVIVKNNGLAMHAEGNRALMSKAQDQLQGVQQMHTAMKGMLDLSRKEGTTFGVTAEGASAASEFAAYKKAYIAGIRNAYGENSTDATNASLEKLANVDLSDWRQGITRAKIQGLAKSATNEVNARYSVMGLGFDPNDWDRRQGGGTEKPSKTIQNADGSKVKVYADGTFDRL